MPVHALLDVGTRSLLTISRFAPVVVFLAEAIPDSTAEFHVRTPTSGKEFPAGKIDPSEYPRWAWDRKSARAFVPVALEVQTEDIRERSRLAHAKAKAIEWIMKSIGTMRAGVSTGVLFQETVYAGKKLEALALRTAGYTTETPHMFPYVVQYADYAGLSLKEATDRILFRAELDDGVLAKTEILRLRYFDRLKSAATPKDVDAVMRDYRRDTTLNGEI